MGRSFACALALILSLLVAAETEAATYHVGVSGNDANSCASAQSESSGSQKRTIAAGVACLSPGDTLLIHGGTYGGTSNIIDSQTQTVRSGTPSSVVTIAGAPGETVIMTPPAGWPGIRLINGSPSYLVFKNFVIDLRNSNQASEGDGIVLSTAHHNRFEHLEITHVPGFAVHFDANTPFNAVVNCSIHDTGTPGVAPTIGHGLYITGSDNLFEGNDVYNNQGFGFHVYNNGGAHNDPSRNIIRNNRVHGNGVNGSTAFGIVVAWGDRNVVVNNLVYGNRAGIQVYTGSSNTAVYNNTIYGNAAEGVALQYYIAAPIVENNIVFANGAPIRDYGGTAIIDHNVTSNPGFTNASAGDFTLQPGSAAQDTGVTVSAVTNDFSYVARPQGAGYDVGAFEVPGPVSRPPAPNNLRISSP